MWNSAGTGREELLCCNRAPRRRKVERKTGKGGLSRAKNADCAPGATGALELGWRNGSSAGEDERPVGSR